MKTIAVIGASGFVGSALYKTLKKNNTYRVVSVVRANYDRFRRQAFDIVINAAMPSARFWAKNNPQDDFRETVEKTAHIVYDWNYKKVVHISSVSARSQLDTIYGRHKAAAEAIVNFGDNLAVRFGPMFDETLSKGVLVDMMQGKTVYIDGTSRYAFSSLEFNVNWIVNNLHKRGIREVGAKNALALKTVAKYLKKNIQFEGPIDHQEIQNPLASFPDATEVYSYLESKRQ